MQKDKRSVEKVRASRDGHEYHEAWTARRAMQLLWPDSALTAIAVEGLSPRDQPSASAETAEIADIVLYYGDTAFEKSYRTTVSQFKYSVADKKADFRASHAKKTIEKFAKTYRDYIAKYGAQAVKAILDFELITNRPIYGPLQQAVEALAKCAPQTGEVAKQSKQLKAASGLDGASLAAFATKLKLVGLSGSLSANKNELTGLIIDWSWNSDPLAGSRLGQLRQMVRDKAGDAGAQDNLIRRTDILAALHITDADDLLPCKTAIPDPGSIVEREQLSSALDEIEHLSMPLLVHAAGGVGKTVFMDSLANALRKSKEVVFFDCFGGGAYRSPSDARHLAKKGLVHIANTLAFRGLCDPILPDGTDVEGLLRTFRRRLAQVVTAIRSAVPGGELVLFIDAIDNAGLIACERSEKAFPIQLLESLHHEPISGVKLVVSCRTERKPATHARFQEFQLRPFTINELTAYLSTRIRGVTHAEINVAQARSGGNPRVLQYLVSSGREALIQSEINRSVELDDLIQSRILSALSSSVARGYSQQEIDAFLAGLAVLPPPVPLDEYAGAQGMQLSEIESFAADLSPLLERTNQGLMFRDEPTETLVRNRYASSDAALHVVAANLLARQDTSVYAARALPGLLHKLDDGAELFRLAFDERTPCAITSTVGKRNIRYARIKAAVLHAAIKRDYDKLVQLLVELSTLASVDERGADYILDCPGLVVAAGDADATRRLFELRTGWPGTRHSRLAIANSLSGESGEAYRHAVAADEWIHHYRRTVREDRIGKPNPDSLDIAAIPIFLVCQGRPQHAARFLQTWQSWYSYEVSAHVFSHLGLATQLDQLSSRYLASFWELLAEPGSLAGALSFCAHTKRTAAGLVTRLAWACRKSKEFNFHDSFERKRGYRLQDGLRKASAIALSLGLVQEALAISKRAPHERPRIWSVRDRFYHNDASPFVFRVALVSAATGKPVHEKDVLPIELLRVGAGIPKRISGKDFRDKLKAKLPKFVRDERDENQSPKNCNLISRDEKQEAERFIDQQLDLLLTLTKAFAKLLGAPARSVDKAFNELISIWETARKRPDPYRTEEFDHFFRFLGLEIAIFSLWSRAEIKKPSVKRFIVMAEKQNVGAHMLIRVVSILAKSKSMHSLAGEQAIKAHALIQTEDDVTYRASLYKELAWAIMPASIDDASKYFRDGLDKMDAIGSGDYEFTNELLLFASTLKGNELDEADFHTLSNICELNMGEEAHKFNWGAYGRGMSRAAGIRGLAKLSRWDDRSRIDLSYTLLPYLTALIEDGKLQPDTALTLNRLADPAEYFERGTKEFAQAIREKAGPGGKEIISELIDQFLDNNPGVPMDTTVGDLALLAAETFGEQSVTAKYLTAAQGIISATRLKTNEHMNYHGVADTRLSRQVDVAEQKSLNRRALKAIAKAAIPVDQNSLNEAIDRMNELEFIYDVKGEFFGWLRAKVPFKARGQYVRNVCALAQLNLYGKLEELKVSKEDWKNSSAALADIYRDIAVPLVHAHADDLVDHGRLSGYKLKEISDLTGVSTAYLILELIKSFARPDVSASGATWLGFACFVSSEASDGMGQAALRRLLNSNAAQLANSVPDGPWQSGLYPGSDLKEVASGLIWRMLGSPVAEVRWRAAHSIRCLARFGRWEIVDTLVKRLSTETAGPFQAQELAFYFLHARLWLLIALARVAIDYPLEITAYKDALLAVATENDIPHVLMRHFAAMALVSCIDARKLTLPADIEQMLRSADDSPHPRLRQKIRTNGNFYQGRPKSTPKPSFEFHLDYDFHKQDLDNLSHVFGKPCWEVEDSISGLVHGLDPNVSSMYETGGRQSRNRRGVHGMTETYHTLGQQLGWHALFFAAGKLLKDSPVTDDWWYDDDPWGEWLGRYLLTRRDGFWLSDATDRTPLDTVELMLEKAKEGLVLTGDREKLLALAKLTGRVGQELVVDGHWYSPDNIRVHISSALVVPGKVKQLVRKLLREPPMFVGFPVLGEDEFDDPMGGKKQYVPWIVHPEGEARLDTHDPFCTPDANRRPRLGLDCASALQLAVSDRFGREWKGKRGRVLLRAEAWGRDSNDSERGPHSGIRLLCSASALRETLKKKGKHLILVVSIQRYEQSIRRESKFTHSVGFVRISDTLDVDYFRGRINYLHKSRF